MSTTTDVRTAKNPRSEAGSGAPKGELLQLRTDRRLGHEWDDWDGNPLPDDGVFTTGPALLFKMVLASAGIAAALLGLVLWLVAPRLAVLWAPLPAVAAWSLLAGLLLVFAWTGLLAYSLRAGRAVLPERLAERGPLAGVMPLLERLAGVFGVSRDRLGNSALRVYNGLAAARSRPGVKPDDVLILLPRCLSKDAMRGAMEVAGRYGVPLFVAARGMYARKMIKKRRPHRIVAVACERDLVSGIHDVAAKLPVLGTTLTLPDGPCKNTEVNLDGLEAHIQSFLGLEATAPADPGRA